MAKWVSAPGAGENAPEPGPVRTLLAWMEGHGIETGLLGAGLIALGGAFLLVGLVRVWLVLRGRMVERYAAGEIVDVEPGEGGGLIPVIAYTDAEGRTRRFVADFATAGDPTGRRVRLRIDGVRPQIAGPTPSAFREATGMVLPLLLGGLIASAGITGRVAGIVPLPGL